MRRQQRRRQAVILFLFYTSGERAPGDGGTDPPSPGDLQSQQSLPSLQAAPPLLVPVPHPAPRGQGLAEGLGVWGGWGVRVLVSTCREAGGGSAVGCQSVRLAGSCWENQGTLSPQQGEPAAPCRGLRQMNGWAGDHPLTPLAPVGSGAAPSVRFQLVAGLRPPCPLRLQGCSPAWIWGPCSDSQGRPGMWWGSWAGRSPRQWLLAVCYSSLCPGRDLMGGWAGRPQRPPTASSPGGTPWISRLLLVLL